MVVAKEKGTQDDEGLEWGWSEGNAGIAPATDLRVVRLPYAGQGPAGNSRGPGVPWHLPALLRGNL